MRTLQPLADDACALGFEHEPRGGGAHRSWRRRSSSPIGTSSSSRPITATRSTPFGTALTLAQVAAAERPGSTIVCGRAGEGRRHPGQIGVQALRGGTVVGHHEEHFYGQAEHITLSHRAESRDQFASGALRAAQWISGRPPGWYSLEEVLGL